MGRAHQEKAGISWMEANDVAVWAVELNGRPIEDDDESIGPVEEAVDVQRRLYGNDSVVIEFRFPDESDRPGGHGPLIYRYTLKGA